MKKFSLLTLAIAFILCFSTYLSAQVLYNDFDNVQLSTFGFHNGTLTQPAPNPSATGINRSANVCQYVRDAASTYDVLILRAPGDCQDVTPYITGQKKMKMKFYSRRQGVQISITLEDTSSSSPTNYPTGRHSVYRATTTKANAWELLEFNYFNRPDANAFNDNIQVLTISIASNTQDGSTYYMDSIAGPEYAQPSPTIVGENMLEDFESVRKLQYGFKNGTWIDKAANPGADPVDSSLFVGQYTRNAAAQYDVLIAQLDGNMADIPLYMRGKRKFTIKLYTGAPIGTPLTLTLEDTGRSRNAGYPRGRHSIYRAVTTVQNQWEYLVFRYYERPDANCPDNKLSQITFSFNSNTRTGDTYYFDELRGPNIILPTVLSTKNYGWDGFEGCGRVKYHKKSGTLSVVANPNITPDNTSANCASYVRSSLPNDQILVTPENNPTDMIDFKTGVRKFSMKVWSAAPGKLVTITAQDSLTVTPTNYPLGRYAEFSATTTKTNEWETLVFNRTALPDQLIDPGWVSQLAIAFEPGITATNQYYFDDLYGPKFTSTSTGLCPTVGLPANVAGNARLTCYPNPTKDLVNISFWQPTAGNVKFTLTDALGRIVKTQELNDVFGGTQSHQLNVAGLSSGLYHLNAICNGSIGTFKLQVK